jgi:hypothetical protein
MADLGILLCRPAWLVGGLLVAAARLGADALFNRLGDRRISCHGR